MHLRRITDSDTFVEYLRRTLMGGWFAYRIVAVTLIVLVAFAAIRLVRHLVVTLRLALRLKRNRGRPWTHREWCAQKGRLPYFHLQDVIRFLKVQEKISTSAIVCLCERKGIDTSEFKERISAFINQGVINSG